MANSTGDYKLLIGGERVAASGGSFEVTNPATGEVVGEAPDATPADAAAAAQAAADAFPAWSRTTPAARAELLARAADLLDKAYADLVPLVQAETGATMRVTKQMQVPMASVRLRRYAQGAMEPTQLPVPPAVMPSTALGPGGLVGGVAVRQPVGVVACITSYNFPLTNMAGKIGPALAMGNTVVVKPAPQDPLGVIRMAEIIDEAGFPPGVINVIVEQGSDAGAALVADDLVDMISFTGSTGVGRTIGAVAGGRMARLLLELGGKGAAVVFEDADLRAAVTGITSTWAFHSGQICTAPTRVLVHRSVEEQLIEALTSAAGRLTIGDPLERETVVGPVISTAHRDRVQGFIDGAVAQGAQLATSADLPDGLEGAYVAPTLLAGCRHDMTAVQEEIFGPVVAVVPFDDEDEAVAMANGTSFGLYDYVFSSDTARAHAVAMQLRAGTVGINTVQRNHELPFGGFKQSGVGRDGGSFGLHAYSELQSITWAG